jgi:PTS system nitrogen regulatory IIA component
VTPGREETAASRRLPMPEPAPLNIRDVLDPERVLLRVPSGSKHEILSALVDAMASTHGDVDRRALVANLIERERTCTTAIADGIAIPHGRHAVGDQVVCTFGRSREGVDFDSVDGAPTKLIFLLVSPETNPTLHLRWLAHLAVLLRDPEFRAALLAAETADEVVDCIERVEQAQAQGTGGR